MKRFNSPIGTMVEVADGAFVTFAEHEAAMARKPSFAEHMKQHDHYENRAAKIASIFRAEKAINSRAFFTRLESPHVDDSMAALEMEDVHVADCTRWTLLVPLALFDTNDDSDVVIAARQHKAAELERIGKEQQAAAAKREKEERTKLTELLAKYPDLKPIPEA